uniref:Uncharacterized protein n=1 Tax=Attheya septentrionalis TaxID=420275 RepID=A0A7S2U5Q0_9STRA|mmetsp:Transcript_11601/g.21118  ORF Transcript_11601/g.21118 Transcript_11601/m.21118 type:complete len:669 (+) Transcript_11601:62-2068(+)
MKRQKITHHPPFNMLQYAQSEYTQSELTLLPEELWERHVLTFLDAPDVLNFVSTDKDIAYGLSRRATLWKGLLQRDGGVLDPIILQPPLRWEMLKFHFVLQSQVRRLRTAEWRPTSSKRINSPTSREGHSLVCLPPPASTASNVARSGERLVLFGGFCDDDGIHILDTMQSSSSSNKNVAQPPDLGVWRESTMEGEPAPFCYGFSLTALDGNRLLRFGGFRRAGYSAVCADLWLLTLTDAPSNDPSQPLQTSARWEMITCNGRVPMGRGYHTATFLWRESRYLLFIGGMTSRGSHMDAAFLDTHTWTWIDLPKQYFLALLSNGPSGRHGHSVLPHFTKKKVKHRNRLVLFGGGSGMDLLRSGVDNSEVWELLLPNSFEEGNNGVIDPDVWKWKLVHRDSHMSPRQPDDQNDMGHRLSWEECLCLGRCHIGVKISPTNALFFSGSGRPYPTNGVMGYNFETDEWMRPNITSPFKPRARFTAAGAYMCRGGWFIAHGGYSSLASNSINDMCLLDLAPQLKADNELRQYPLAFSAEALQNIDEEPQDPSPQEQARLGFGDDHFMHVTVLSVETLRDALGPVDEEDDGPESLHVLFNLLINAPTPEYRRVMALHILGQERDIQRRGRPREGLTIPHDFIMMLASIVEGRGMLSQDMETFRNAALLETGNQQS